MSICLCMIVRNEESNINKYLERNLSYFDTFCIVDTGSDDNTIEAIVSVAKKANKQGLVHKSKWINFEQNRNECLCLSRNVAEWLFMMDADDSIYGEKFGAVLSAKYKGYYIKSVFGGDLMISSRVHIFNNAFEWRYKGVVHEYPYCEAEGSIGKLDEETYLCARTEGFRSTNKDKYKDDALLLESELLSNPDCDRARTLFYLAQSYLNAGNDEQAKRNYLARAEFGGWREEVYVSYMKLISLTNDADEIIQYAWKAQTAVPSRKDAVYLALQFARKNNVFREELFALGYAYKDCPLDATHLFVEAIAYGWSYWDELSLMCYYTDRKPLCKEFATIALGSCPDSEKPRIEKNIGFC
jgi:glycosyltransferase involved in cell wall biosynthesis